MVGGTLLAVVILGLAFGAEHGSSTAIPPATSAVGSSSYTCLNGQGSGQYQPKTTQELVNLAPVILKGTVTRVGQMACPLAGAVTLDGKNASLPSFSDALVKLDCIYANSGSAISLRANTEALVTGFGDPAQCLSAVAEGDAVFLLVQPTAAALLPPGSAPAGLCVDHDCSAVFPDLNATCPGPILIDVPVFRARYDDVSSAAVPSTNADFEAAVNVLKLNKACSSATVSGSGSSTSSSSSSSSSSTTGGRRLHQSTSSTVRSSVRSSVSSSSRATSSSRGSSSSHASSGTGSRAQHGQKASNVTAGRTPTIRTPSNIKTFAGIAVPPDGLPFACIAAPNIQASNSSCKELAFGWYKSPDEERCILTSTRFCPSPAGWNPYWTPSSVYFLSQQECDAACPPPAPPPLLEETAAVLPSVTPAPTGAAAAPTPSPSGAAESINNQQVTFGSGVRAFTSASTSPGGTTRQSTRTFTTGPSGTQTTSTSGPRTQTTSTSGPRTTTKVFGSSVASSSTASSSASSSGSSRSTCSVSTRTVVDQNGKVHTTTVRTGDCGKKSAAAAGPTTQGPAASAPAPAPSVVAQEVQEEDLLLPAIDPFGAGFGPIFPTALPDCSGPPNLVPSGSVANDGVDMSCAGIVEGYYFDAASGTCLRNVFSGCPAEGQPWPTLWASDRDCEEFCTSATAGAPQAAAAPANASAAAPSPATSNATSTTTSSVTSNITSSNVTGSVNATARSTPINLPRAAPVHVSTACRGRPLTVTGAGARCARQPPLNGSYFEPLLGQCHNGRFAGCSLPAHTELFNSTKECMAACAPVAQNVTNPECLYPEKVQGPCTSNLTRWSFVTASGLCEPYKFGGCLAGPNSFADRASCNEACIPSAVPPAAAPLPVATTCALPVAAGPCRGYFPRYAFDAATNSCELFVYGGCLGNDNNFASRATCEAVCLQS